MTFPVLEKVVQIPNGEGIVSLPVRGLSTADITWLVQRFGPAMSAAFTRLRETGLALSADDLTAMVSGEMFTEGPLLAAGIIAAGADMRDDLEGAYRLPFSVQLEILTAIGELTFVQEGGAKKVLETVIRMASAVQSVTEDPKA